MTTESAFVSSATRAMRDHLVRSADAAIIFDYVRAKGAEGIKFDVWYCNTHLSALKAEHPIGRLRRYTAPSRASYLAIGELQNMPDRKESEQSGSVIPALVEYHERFVGEPLGTQRRRDVSEDVIEAAVVYPALLRVPDDRLPALSRWYDEEHLPMLLSCPQWVMARRFRITAARGLNFTHVALHYLTNVSALQSPQRDAARSTPWRDSLIAEGWFAPEYRVCYRVQDF